MPWQTMQHALPLGREHLHPSATPAEDFYSQVMGETAAMTVRSSLAYDSRMSVASTGTAL